MDGQSERSAALLLGMHSNPAGTFVFHFRFRVPGPYVIALRSISVIHEEVMDIVVEEKNLL